MPRHAVILAGGMATRLGALAKNTPKPLLSVGGRPFIAHIIAHCRRHGVCEFIVLAGPHEHAFRSALGNGRTLGVSIEVVAEPVQAGTAGALLYVHDRLEDPFLLLNGDSLFQADLSALPAGQVRTVPTPQPWGMIAVRRVADTGRYGRVEVDDGLITRFGEKSVGGAGLINAGVYHLSRRILDVIGKPPVSLEQEVFPRLVREKLLRAHLLAGNFIDIGIPEDLERARELVPAWLGGADDAGEQPGAHWTSTPSNP
jgi:D-glycero-D-manno-heptose 1,7-bisphosphate phosphatase